MRPMLPACRRLGGAVAFVVLAVAAFTAAPASAATCHQHVYGETCESEKEHAEFQAFANCPFEAASELDCSWALSTAKEVWPSLKVKEEWETERGRKAPGLPSEIKAGNVTVPIRNAIVLRGGIGFLSEENEEWFGAEGVPTILPVAEPAQPITKDVNTALLSESELSRYDYYTKVAHDTKVTATVELAGPASSIQVNAINLLSETGSAFTFPVRLHLVSGFGGPECYVGTEAEPVVVSFTTGTSGSLQGKNGSTIKEDRGGFILTVETDTLVNNTFASPGVTGCGIEGGADAAIDSALGLPSPAGSNEAVLDGTLRLSTAEDAKLGLEGKI